MTETGVSSPTCHTRMVACGTLPHTRKGTARACRPDATKGLVTPTTSSLHDPHRNLATSNRYIS